MEKSSTRDMTNGSPMKLILGFSVPLLFGFLFQQFYSVVNMIIVGRFLGVEALAGVGSTGSVNFLIIGFCMGVCNGFAIPLAHKFGAKDFSGMRRFIANSIWLSILFAAVMTVATTLFCRPLLLLMRTPENIFDDAYTYIFIIFIGIPATYLYNLLSGVIRAMGDSKTPLVFLTISSFLNIILDLVFIVVCGLGVAGAAIGTIVSQMVSGIMCLLYIRKFSMLRIEKEEWKINLFHMKTLCIMGIPMGLQYSITAIGSVILQSAVNTLGSGAVATVTAASKVSLFFCCPFEALGAGIATYGGQNVGAKKLDRLGEGLKASIVLGIVYSVIAFVVLFFFGGHLASLFLDAGETHLITDARLFLIINSAFYIPLTFVNIVRFMIQGMGFSSFAILAGVCEMVARSLAGILLVPAFGFVAACFASPLAWIFADLFLIPAYIHVRKKLGKMLVFSTADN
ncbi:putative MATE family efflux protein [Kineothrix alysoides]|uniref:Putative MATE family efflux protein n=1 Tax=Kineothrix alysoides TaxID=1469948 RepID=A0A4R1R1Q1_9FIRM|nr:MATE family efflux transporter [Kineothrix alysoides]TCL59270.1 putative MATE family efflux protein [Kineothrix alysoides]